MKKTKNNPAVILLRVLILEDIPADAELVERALRRAGIDFTSRLVKGKREYGKALAEFRPQIILSDFKLPKFNGQAALEIACTQAPDVPFIFVSGSIGEEKAIELLAQGASDYIFKDNLARLGPAVKRVIEATRLQLARKKIDEELRRHVEELRILAEAADRFVQTNDLDEMYEYLAQVIRDISGADYLLLSLYDEKLLAVKPKIVTGFKPLRETMRRRFHFDPLQMVLYLKDMRKDAFSDFVSRRLLPVRDGLYGLVNRKLARQRCRTIEKLLDIGSMHTMGFSWENQLYGGVTVFFKKGNKLKNHAQIETLLNQAAVAIKRLLAEKSLHASEEKYRILVTQSPDGIFVIDLQGNFLSVNQAMCTGLKYNEAEFLSLKIWDIVPEQYVDLHKKRMANIMKGKAQNEAAEYMVRGKDKEIHYVEILSAPYYKDNELIGLQGIARDVTERKLAEEQIQYQASLLQKVSDAIIATDKDGNIQVWNKAAEKIYGWKTEETIGKKLHDLINPEYRYQSREEVIGKLDQEEVWSGEILHQIRDGKKIPVSSTITIMKDAKGDPAGMVSVNHDISERKRVEEVIAQSERKYREVVENASDIIFTTDASGKFTYANAAGLINCGYTMDELLNFRFTDLVLPEYRHRLLRLYYDQRSSKNPASYVEYQFRKKNGEARWLAQNATLIIQNEKISGFHVIARDITERRQAEAEILRQKAFLEKLVESAPEGIAITDCPGRVLQVNSEFVRMFGYEADEAVGKMIDDLLAPPGYQEEAGRLTRTSGAGEKIVLETVRKRKDGTLFNVSIIGAPINIGEQQVAVYAIYRDISNRKQAEEQIRASLKEKEVLLQEIHHRVKNNLQIISGLLTLQAEQSTGKSLDDIFSVSQDRIRSIALIHEKLYQSHNLAEIAFDEYLRALTDNLFTTHGVAAGRITAKYEMESIFFTIEKAIPLGLIVNELVTNALKHAFPAGQEGEIRIGLHGYEGAKSYTLKTDSGMLHVVPTCELIVADNGVGLPTGQIPEQQKSLGMKLVSMLAKQIQAELKVKTGPGTEFRLLFPGLPAKEAVQDNNHGG